MCSAADPHQAVARVARDHGAGRDVLLAAGACVRAPCRRRVPQSTCSRASKTRSHSIRRSRCRDRSQTSPPACRDHHRHPPDIRDGRWSVRLSGRAAPGRHDRRPGRRARDPGLVARVQPRTLAGAHRRDRRARVGRDGHQADRPRVDRGSRARAVALRDDADVSGACPGGMGGGGAPVRRWTSARRTCRSRGARLHRVRDHSYRGRQQRRFPVSLALDADAGRTSARASQRRASSVAAASGASRARERSGPATALRQACSRAAANGSRAGTRPHTRTHRSGQARSRSSRHRRRETRRVARVPRTESRQRGPGHPHQDRLAGVGARRDVAASDRSRLVVVRGARRSSLHPGTARR